MDATFSHTYSPESAPSSDPGADVQRRFRYQAAYASLVAVKLLADDSDIEKVFCEHHEDVLVKCIDGRFIGIQVKTRQSGLEPLKTGDDEIRSALSRFLELEKQFPISFSTYVIAANCGFYSARKNSSNLRHLAETVCVAFRSTKDLPKNETARLNKLAKQLKCTSDSLLPVLCKLELRGDLPQFGDIVPVLARQIAQADEMKKYTYREVNAVADALLNYLLEAAALSCDDSARLYFVFAKDPEMMETETIIKRKTITRDVIKTLLVATASETSRLKCATAPSADALPRGARLLQQKMASGGVSVENISLATDHKVSAEYLFQQWFFKYGQGETNSRYHHLRTIVRTEAYEAHDETASDDQPYGAAMLDKIRSRLRARHQADSSSLFGVHYEQLLGVAGILTEECTLWWGKPFPIETLK
jgi:Cap4 dsDNA endonuclease